MPAALHRSRPLLLLLAACAPPPAAPPEAPSSPPAATLATAAPPAPAPTPSTNPAPAPATNGAGSTSWKTELARGAAGEVMSLARVGDSLWAAGWYGDPHGGSEGKVAALPLRKGNYDPFAAHLTNDGAIVWQGRLEGATGLAVAAASDGDALIAGEFVGEIPGALVPRSPVLHAFVAKLGAASHRVHWTSGPNSMDIEHAWAIAPAPDGGAYLASELHAVARRAGEPSSRGGPDILVSRFDAQGKRLWRTPMGTPQSDFPFALAALPGGDVVVAGVVDAPHAYSDTAAVKSRGLVARLGKGGEIRWEKRFGGAGVNFAGGVAADASGHIFVTGVISGEVRLGAQTYRAEGHHDIIVAALDGGGDVAWIRRVATTRSARTDSRNYGARFVLLWGGGEPQFLPRIGNGLVPASIAVAPDGTMAIGGWFVDPLTIGDRTFGAAMKESGFIASLRADGAVRWVATPDQHVNAVLAENDAVLAASGQEVMKLATR